MPTVVCAAGGWYGEAAIELAVEVECRVGRVEAFFVLESRDAGVSFGLGKPGHVRRCAMITAVSFIGLAFLGLVQLSTWILVFVHRREVWSRRWQVVLAFIALEGLALPGQWATYRYLVVPDGPDGAAGLAAAMIIASSLMGGFIAALQVPLCAIAWDGFARTRPAHMGVGLVVGMALGLASAVLFHRLSVGVGQPILALASMFPEMPKQGWLAQLLILSTFLTAAVTEELTYRGMALGWTRRVTRPRRAVEGVLVLLLAIVWATGHAPNTDWPMLKLIQITLLGLLFGGAVLRWSFSAAVALHVGVNLGAQLAAVVLL